MFGFSRGWERQRLKSFERLAPVIGPPTITKGRKMKTKQVVLIRIPSFLPDNFTYTCYQPMQHEDEKHREAEKLIQESIGNIVIELPVEKADDLCKRAGAAIMLQVELEKLIRKEEKK